MADYQTSTRRLTNVRDLATVGSVEVASAILAWHAGRTLTVHQRDLVDAAIGNDALRHLARAYGVTPVVGVQGGAAA